MEETLSKSEAQLKGEPIHEELAQAKIVIDGLPPSPIVRPRRSSRNMPLL